MAVATDPVVSNQEKILANQTNDCVADPGYTGKIISLGYNLIETSYYCTLTTTDRINIDPGFVYLKGQPAYYPLSPNSPAIDAGNPAPVGSGDDACPVTDQRGVARSGGGGCDLGAFELTHPAPTYLIYLPLIVR